MVKDILIDPFYLEHHGILGQKWGQRRYQNSDGSLTDEGRARYGVGQRITNKINEIRYGKTFDSSNAANIQTRFGKTKYTNLDGTLNEKGKKLSATFTQKEINKNNKYYDKVIKKYNKAAEAFKDDDATSNAFKKMAESAQKSKDRTNENLKNLSLDQIIDIQTQRNNKAIGIAGGIAGIVGVSGLVTAAAKTINPKTIINGIETFDPTMPIQKLEAWSQTDKGQKAMSYVDATLRTYSDVRAYALGTMIDQSMVRLDKMGVPQAVGQTIGTTVKEAKNASGVQQDYNNLLNDVVDFTKKASQVTHSGMEEEDMKLEHHGIHGQKWGIRRYQNEDGSLTEAGKKRYRAENVESITDRKGLQRRLNDIDKSMARNQRDNTDAVRKLVSGKSYKNKAIVKKALTEDNITKGRNEIEDLLKKNSDKYDIKSVATSRNVSKGSDYVKAFGTGVLLSSVLGPIGAKVAGATGAAAGIGIGNGLANVKYQKIGLGTKYKVKEKETNTSEKKLKEVKTNEEKLKEAKVNKQYEMGFLEAIQNKKILTQTGAKAQQKVDSEYAKYLKDPDKYWKEERHKLKDDDGLD